MGRAGSRVSGGVVCNEAWTSHYHQPLHEPASEPARTSPLQRVARSGQPSFSPRQWRRQGMKRDVAVYGDHWR